MFDGDPRMTKWEVCRSYLAWWIGAFLLFSVAFIFLLVGCGVIPNYFHKGHPTEVTPQVIVINSLVMLYGIAYGIVHVIKCVNQIRRLRKEGLLIEGNSETSGVTVITVRVVSKPDPETFTAEVEVVDQKGKPLLGPDAAPTEEATEKEAADEQ